MYYVQNSTSLRVDGSQIQCCGSGSGIRIRIGSVFNRTIGSGSRRAKMTHKSRKNSCFEVLDGLICELEASSLFWTYFMEA